MASPFPQSPLSPFSCSSEQEIVPRPEKRFFLHFPSSLFLTQNFSGRLVSLGGVSSSFSRNFTSVVAWGKNQEQVRKQDVFFPSLLSLSF